jgi:hypothetical protein
MEYYMTMEELQKEELRGYILLKIMLMINSGRISSQDI